MKNSTLSKIWDGLGVAILLGALILAATSFVKCQLASEVFEDFKKERCLACSKQLSEDNLERIQIHTLCLDNPENVLPLCEEPPNVELL